MKLYFFFFIYLLLALFSIVNAGDKLDILKSCTLPTSPPFCSYTRCISQKYCPKECGLCPKSDD